MKLSETQIQEELTKLPEWEYEQDSLYSTFEFANFAESMTFVHEIATLAEERNHHPRITIEYAYVELALHTHDEGGVTQQDIDFAHAVEQLVREPDVN